MIDSNIYSVINKLNFHFMKENNSAAMDPLGNSI